MQHILNFCLLFEILLYLMKKMNCILFKVLIIRMLLLFTTVLIILKIVIKIYPNFPIEFSKYLTLKEIIRIK